MKNSISFLILMFVFALPQIQTAQINNSELPLSIRSDGIAPDASAMLDVQSSSKGLLVPRMKTVQRDGISAPAKGLLVYDIDIGAFFFYNGSAWTALDGTVLTVSDHIQDQDGDTRVHTESQADEDKIRFALDGQEHFQMHNGKLKVFNTGHSVFFGNGAGDHDDHSNNRQVGLGDSALFQSVVGFNNVAVGYKSLYSTNGSYNNVAMGYLSLMNCETGSQNTSVGSESMRKNINGWYNTAIGSQSLFENTSGSRNTAVGRGSLLFNTTGRANTAIGDVAMHVNSDGEENAALGVSALYNNTTGSFNCSVGAESLDRNETGNSNVAVGMSALKWNLDNSNLVAVGDSALYHNGNNDSLSTDGTNNVALGSKTLFSNTRGQKNTAIGSGSLYSNETGSYNTVVGYNAEGYNGSGDRNTIIGTNAGSTPLGSNRSGSIFIGYNAGYFETADDKLYIENSFSSNPLIYGDFNSDVIGINGNLGVRTESPAKEIHIKDGPDGDSDVYMRLQSIGENNDAVIEYYENTAKAMSIHYSGSDNALHLIDLTQTNPATRFTFLRNGKAGIGVDNPGNILTIKQSSATDPIADSWTTYSSRRWKTNIHTIENALETVTRLRGVYYDWKANGQHDIGLIAEEVGTVLPEIVQYEENGVDAKSVDYARLVPVLIEAVKELKAENHRLNKELVELKKILN